MSLIEKLYGLEVSSSAATLGSNRLQLLSSETVINQAGASVDFRVEGDTASNLLLCDASTDRVILIPLVNNTN